MRLLSALLLFSSAAPSLAAERNYSVTDYDRIRLDAPVRVTVATGRAPSARATGDQAGIDRLKVEVQGRTLVIGRNVSAWGATQPSGPIEVRLTAHDLSAATVQGAGTLAIDRLRGAKLELVVAGSGVLDVGAVETERLMLGVVGDGRAAVAGTAKRADLILRGPGSVAAEKLAADDLKLAAEGPGSVTASARKTADVTSSGSGAVTVTGDPACTVKATGSAEVKCGE